MPPGRRHIVRKLAHRLVVESWPLDLASFPYLLCVLLSLFFFFFFFHPSFSFLIKTQFKKYILNKCTEIAGVRHKSAEQAALTFLASFGELTSSSRGVAVDGVAASRRGDEV